MSLKLEWLHYFVVLAESQSFNIAADRLCISQQALSKHLAQIETRLGGQLVQRAQRFEKLTPAGELLLQKARRILAHAETLETLFLSADSSAVAAPLRLAAAPFLEPRLVDFLRGLLADKRGQVQPQLIQALTVAEIVSRLEQHQLELALLPQVPRSLRRLSQKLFTQSPYVIVTAPGQTADSWEQLGFIRLLGPDPAHQLEIWPEREWPRKIVAEADFETAMGLCRRGAGALVLPRALAEPDLQQQLLQLGPVMPFEQNYRSFLVCSDSTRAHPECADWFGRLVTKEK